MLPWLDKLPLPCCDEADGSPGIELSKSKDSFKLGSFGLFLFFDLLDFETKELMVVHISEFRPFFHFAFDSDTALGFPICFFVILILLVFSEILLLIGDKSLFF